MGLSEPRNSKGFRISGFGLLKQEDCPAVVVPLRKLNESDCFKRNRSSSQMPRKQPLLGDINKNRKKKKKGKK